MRLFDRFQHFTDADLVRAIENRESEIMHRESEIKVLKEIQKQRLARTQPTQMDTEASAVRMIQCSGGVRDEASTNKWAMKPCPKTPVWIGSYGGSFCDDHKSAIEWVSTESIDQPTFTRINV